MNQLKPQVLIVDDQNSIRRTMTVIVENWGCQAVAVDDGYHAIESVKNKDFDLVFLDIKMPGINGVQTFREIKKLKPDSLVVMMTGCEVQELIDLAVDEGAMSMLLKPFEPKQIVQVLHSVNETCPERIPTNIGGLTVDIQTQIDVLIEELSFARLAIRVPDNEMKALRLLAVAGPASERTPMLASFASSEGGMFYHNELQVRNDFNLQPTISDSDMASGFKSTIGMPIQSNSGRTLGTVFATSYEANYFNQDVVGRLHDLAGELANKMEAVSLAEAEFLDSRHRVGVPTF